MASRHVPGLSSADGLIITVRFKSHQKSYELERSSTVAELRQQLAADYNVPETEMKILLGGSILADDTTVEDSGVGMESMLFAIQHKTPSAQATTKAEVSGSQLTAPTASADTDGTSVNSCGNSSAMTSAVAPALSSKGDYRAKQLLDQYFVFCKLCRDVRPGRLRVKCSICEGGAVLVDKGPNDWVDVLTPGRVPGSCQSLHCEDCVPIFYFKCVEQHSGNVSGTVVALHHIRPNRRSVLCITCEDVFHVMCLHCFMTYSTFRLHERRFIYSQQYGYTLPCPAGCPDSLIQEQHHFCIMGVEEYNRYKDFAAEECLLADGGMYCPRQECASGFLVDAADSRVVCPYCKHIFCRICRQAPHENECSPQSQMPESSQEFSDPQRAQQAQWEQQTAHTIQETTKGCPGCGTRTERDGGCMHMRCARCGEEWCWLCVKPWDRRCQGAHWFG